MDYSQLNTMQDEDAKHFTIQALPVNENVPVDLTRAPRNGHEYLLRTRLEAAKLYDEAVREESPEENKTVQGNEDILRTRLEAVAAAERTVKKVGLGKLKRQKENERDAKESGEDDREGERETKQDGQKGERTKPDGQRDEEKTKPEGRRDDGRVERDGLIDKKSPKPGVQKEERETKQDGQRDERRTKPDGQRDDKKQDGQTNKKSPKPGVQKGERKAKRKDRLPEAERSGCSESVNEKLFLRVHDQLTKNRGDLQEKFPKETLPLEDKEECCLFCLGSKLYGRIYERKVEKCSPHLPLLSYVVHLDEEEVLLLIEYCYEWYLNVGIHDTIAKWLYALLACLDRPISNEKAFGMLESFYLSCFKGRCQDLEYPYQCFVESMMRKLSVKDD